MGLMKYDVKHKTNMNIQSQTACIRTACYINILDRFPAAERDMIVI